MSIIKKNKKKNRVFGKFQTEIEAPTRPVDPKFFYVLCSIVLKCGDLRSGAPRTILEQGQGRFEAAKNREVSGCQIRDFLLNILCKTPIYPL